MKATDSQSGVISDNELYTLVELRRRLGLGASALRELKASGVPLRRLGRHYLVLGSDVVSWVRQSQIAGGSQ